MNEKRVRLAILIPLISVLTIIGYAGGLGVVFIVINHTIVEEWAVVVLGSAIVVGVPTAAMLVQRKVENKH